MSYEQYKAAYDTDGFVVVRQLLPPHEFAELKKNLDRYISQIVPGLSVEDAFYEDRSRPETLKQLQNMDVRDEFFANYREHPVWKGLAEALLGEQAHSTGVEWFNKPAGTNHITPPHQDNYYFNLTPPSVLTMWMATDIVDEENGCLRYVPGSHLLGFRPHNRTKTLGFSQGISDYGPDDYAREVPIRAQPGDVLIHHGNTIHRADANRSLSRQRRSVALVFKGVSCRRDEVAYSRYLAQSQANLETLTK